MDNNAHHKHLFTVDSEQKLVFSFTTWPSVGSLKFINLEVDDLDLSDQLADGGSVRIELYQNSSLIKTYWVDVDLDKVKLHLGNVSTNITSGTNFTTNFRVSSSKMTSNSVDVQVVTDTEVFLDNSCF